MSTYSKSQTQNSGSLGEAIEGEKLFTITNSKDPTDTYSVGYFTLDGNATSNQNLSSNAPMGGIFSDFTGGVNPNSLIQTNTRFSISVYGSGGSFKFTPSTPILVNSYYVKSVGEFDIEMAASSQPIVEEFIFKIDTSLGDGLNQYRFTPSHAGVINYTIDWGDSSTTVVVSDVSSTHSYSTSGIYEIKINITSGISNYKLGFSSPDYEKPFIVTNAGTYMPTNFSSAFYCIGGCAGFIDIADTFFLPGASSYSFQATQILNLKLNLDNCTNLFHAFRGATSSDWSFLLYTDIPLVTTMNGMMSHPNNNFDSTTYQLLLIHWTGWNGTTATKSLKPNVPAGFGTAQYEIGGQSEDARNYLINTLGWTITDGGGI